MQYEPFSAGPITGLALGPEATVTLALKSGTTNNVTATLNPAAHVPFDLSVKGSQWAPMFQNAGPGSVTPTDAEITISAQPVGEPLAPTTVRQTLNLPLLLSLPMGTLDGFLAGLPTARCSDSITIGTGSPVTSSSAILTDQDFGTLTYGDPFPLGLYSNLFSFCQAASAEVPVPGGGSPATFSFADGVNTQVPDQPVTPVALPVQNPTINGVSFFTANSFSPTGLTISWSQPGGTSPYAYKVGVVKWTNAPGGGLGYAGVSTYYTGKTSVTLPPLESGQTYVFVLTTEVDSRANVETQPLRTGLPTAFATVISAPITTN
jgi:hypothetical protein